MTLRQKQQIRCLFRRLTMQQMAYYYHNVLCRESSAFAICARGMLCVAARIRQREARG